MWFTQDSGPLTRLRRPMIHPGYGSALQRAPWDQAEETPLPRGCVIAPGYAREIETTNRVQAQDGWTLYSPDAPVDLKPGDRVKDQTGRVYDVVGDVMVYKNPFDPAGPMSTVRLEDSRG